MKHIMVVLSVSLGIVLFVNGIAFIDSSWQSKQERKQKSDKTEQPKVELTTTHISYALFKQASDSFRLYSPKALKALIEGKRDSAMYYRGMMEAYYAMEDIVFPSNTTSNK